MEALSLLEAAERHMNEAGRKRLSLAQELGIIAPENHRIYIMSSIAEHSVSNERFLTMSCNLLAKTFFDSTRTEAKSYYRAVNDGKRLALSKVVMDDESTMDVFLTLDCSEYCGRISFSHFRDQVRLLLHRFSEALKQGEELPVLQEEGGHTSIFKMPVLHAAGDQVNALILGWATPFAGQLELRLMYIDPEQFRQQPEDAG